MHDTSTEPGRITPAAIAALRDWEGRTETMRDEVAPAMARGMAATLDWDAAPAPGDALPPLWHWALFAPRARQSEIGGDGHPRRGGFMPPVPLPRRMWAGGSVEWHAPLRVGEEVERVSRIASVQHKAGRSGDLVFVTVQHEMNGRGGLVMREQQDVVYRPAAQPGDAPAAPQPAPQDADWSDEVRPDPVLLFRYSALTFNAHRIHYDRTYAMQEEGYPGLVVHGPLIATLLAGLAQRNRPGRRIKRFGFRAVRPTFDLNAFHVCGRPSADGTAAALWGRDHEGALTMQADVQFDPLT